MPESKHQYVDGFPQPKKKEEEEDYGEFGYQLEPEYTEEELRQMEECPTSGNREQPMSERHKLVLMLKMHFTTFAVGMPVLP